MPLTAYAGILLPMSNRYSLSQTDSPRPVYLVIDHSLDDEPALHPATLPSGAPHPLAGQPVSVVTSPSPAYKVQDEGRVRTWAGPGGYTVAIVEQVPAGAAAPASTVLRENPAALDGVPDELIHSPPAACQCGPGSRPLGSGAPFLRSAVPRTVPRSGPSTRTSSGAGRTATRPPSLTPRQPALP